MSNQDTARAKLHKRLAPVLDQLERLRLTELVAAQEYANQQNTGLQESLVNRQQSNQLRQKLQRLKPADIAHLIEMLPPRERLTVWEQVDDRVAGDVLWDIEDAVASDLTRNTIDERLTEICLEMDVDDLAQIAEHIPDRVLDTVYKRLAPGERQWVFDASAYEEEKVGHHMTSDIIVALDTDSVKTLIRKIRQLDEIPPQTDQVFIVDALGRMLATLPLNALLLHPPSTSIISIMETEYHDFHPEDDIEDVAQAFERYDLVSAPVVDGKGRLIGRLTVDVIMDFVRESAEEDALLREGLSASEDIFGPVWPAARRRWMWLSINLVTAFLASRVISVFEGTIEQLVALATLMPIVASIGGNTGNQTVALFIRGHALSQINDSNVRYLAMKEVAVSLINGAVWGVGMGMVAYLLYRDVMLGVVMAAATCLNLMVAAAAGVLVPMTLSKLGRDPAFGSSILLTFTTDSMGFLIFLGMAALLLVP